MKKRVVDDSYGNSSCCWITCQDVEAKAEMAERPVQKKER